MLKVLIKARNDLQVHPLLRIPVVARQGGRANVCDIGATLGKSRLCNKRSVKLIFPLKWGGDKEMFWVEFRFYNLKKGGQKNKNQIFLIFFCTLSPNKDICTEFNNYKIP